MNQRSTRKLSVFLLRFLALVPLLQAFVPPTTTSTATERIGQERKGIVALTLSFTRFSATREEPSSVAVVEPVQIVAELPDFLPSKLNNQFYLLRHGLSTANVDSIISSSRSLAYTTRHGLTPEGYEQGKQAAGNLLNLVLPENEGEEIIFVSSPFARAYQTAKATLEGLSEHQSVAGKNFPKVRKEIQIHNGLVERYFGKLDGEAIYTYAYVWPLDKFNVTHTAFDVESVAAVCHRIRNVVLELDAQYRNSHIVLVSHADVLQITQLYAARAPNIGLFSSYRFQNGEVRKMELATTDCLPQANPLSPPNRSTRTSTDDDPR